MLRPAVIPAMGLPPSALRYTGPALVAANLNLTVLELLRRSAARLKDWERADKRLYECGRHQLPSMHGTASELQAPASFALCRAPSGP